LSSLRLLRGTSQHRGLRQLSRKNLCRVRFNNSCLILIMISLNPMARRMFFLLRLHRLGNYLEHNGLRSLKRKTGFRWRINGNVNYSNVTRLQFPPVPSPITSGLKFIEKTTGFEIRINVNEMNYAN
jgi:hypothetical protein